MDFLPTYIDCEQFATRVRSISRVIANYAENIVDNLEPEHAPGSDPNEECCMLDILMIERHLEDLDHEVEDLRTALDAHKMSIRVRGE